MGDKLDECKILQYELSLSNAPARDKRDAAFNCCEKYCDDVVSDSSI